MRHNKSIVSKVPKDVLSESEYLYRNYYQTPNIVFMIKGRLKNLFMASLIKTVPLSILNFFSLFQLPTCAL